MVKVIVAWSSCSMRDGSSSYCLCIFSSSRLAVRPINDHVFPISRFRHRVLSLNGFSKRKGDTVFVPVRRALLGRLVAYLGWSFLPERLCDFAIHVCRKPEVLTLVVRIRGKFEPRAVAAPPLANEGVRCAHGINGIGEGSQR